MIPTGLPEALIPSTLDEKTEEKMMDDIKHLPCEEQSRVVQFALELARRRQLSGTKLAALAQRMVDSDDPTEVERLKANLRRGFYGE